jgi:hypothetical protein
MTDGQGLNVMKWLVEKIVTIMEYAKTEYVYAKPIDGRVNHVILKYVLITVRTMESVKKMENVFVKLGFQVMIAPQTFVPIIVVLMEFVEDESVNVMNLSRASIVLKKNVLITVQKTENA